MHHLRCCAGFGVYELKCFAGLGVYEFRKMTLLGFSPSESEVKRLLELGYKVKY
jgi:hypothetical protein